MKVREFFDREDDKLLLSYSEPVFFSSSEIKRSRKEKQRKLFREVFGELLESNGFVCRANGYVRLYGEHMLQMIGLGYQRFDTTSAVVNLCVTVIPMWGELRMSKSLQGLLTAPMDVDHFWTLDGFANNHEILSASDKYSSYFCEQWNMSFQQALRKYREVFEEKALSIMDKLSDSISYREFLKDREKLEADGFGTNGRAGIWSALALANLQRYDEASSVLNESRAYYQNLYSKDEMDRIKHQLKMIGHSDEEIADYIVRNYGNPELREIELITEMVENRNNLDIQKYVQNGFEQHLQVLRKCAAKVVNRPVRAE